VIVGVELGEAVAKRASKSIFVLPAVGCGVEWREERRIRDGNSRINDRNNNLGYRQDLSDSRWWICVELAWPWSVGDVEGDARHRMGRPQAKGQFGQLNAKAQNAKRSVRAE